jgi:hypothetical protein
MAKLGGLQVSSLRGLGALTLLGLAAGRSEAIRPASAISSLRGG